VQVDETALPREAPEQTAVRLARTKALAAARGAGRGVILGADTIVVDYGQILGKPESVAEATSMLERLSGTTHRVLTGLALVEGEAEVLEVCETEVPMRACGREEIEAYLASGSPLDKAGAYGIQDGGFRPVVLERLEGCFANVMGLPLCHLVRAMERLGHRPSVNVPQACREHTGFICRVHDRILRGEA
jgi:MAF protein